MKKIIEVTFVNAKDEKNTWTTRYMSTHQSFSTVKTERGYVQVVKHEILRRVAKVMGFDTKVKRIEIITEKVIYKDEK